MQHILYVDGEDPMWREILKTQERRERIGLSSPNRYEEMVPSAQMEVLALERSTDNSPRRGSKLHGNRCR